MDGLIVVAIALSGLALLLIGFVYVAVIWPAQRRATRLGLPVRQPAPGSRLFALKLLIGVAFAWAALLRLATKDRVDWLDGLLGAAALAACLLVFLDPNRKKLDRAFEERMSQVPENPTPHWRRMHSIYLFRKTWVWPLGVGLGGAMLVSTASSPSLATMFFGGSDREFEDPLFRVLIATFGLIAVLVAAILALRAQRRHPGSR